MRRRKKVVTTGLLFSTASPKGFTALQTLLGYRRSRTDLCKHALRLLGQIDGQPVYTTTPKGQRFELTLLKLKPLPKRVELTISAQMNYSMPGVAAEWTLGPMSHAGVKVLMHRYGFRVKSKFLAFALEVLRAVAQDELHGARVTRADGTVLSVLPSEYGLKTQPHSARSGPATSTSPTTAGN